MQENPEDGTREINDRSYRIVRSAVFFPSSFDLSPFGEAYGSFLKILSDETKSKRLFRTNFGS